MSDQPKYEKEGQEEKEREKREEKTVEEKWRRDPLGAIIFGIILIWAGLVFLADSMGWLAGISISGLAPGFDVTQPEAWTIVLIGAGVIVLIEAAIRLAVPAYRRPIGGTIILAVVLIGIGLGNIVSWELIWPLIVIGIGLAVLLGGFWRRKA
jgi:hypothetical protein